jgi:hypothetical protein
VKALALVLVLTGLLLVTACGGGDGADSRAKELYGTYRSTEDRRDAAEKRLRDAFSDIAAAAEQQSRADVLAAADRGRSAAQEIDELLAVELEAADDLSAFKAVAASAHRLRTGLATSRRGLALFVQQLEIALEDPFLDLAVNAGRVEDLARRAATLSTDGELLVRRADRATALALGIEPRVDAVLDATTTSSS